MPARDTPVPSMGVVPIGQARRAIRGRVNSLPRDPRLEEGVGDRFGQIERGLAAGMLAKKLRVELRRDLGSDRETAGVDARTDRGSEPIPRDACRFEQAHRVLRDSLPRSAPPAMEEYAPPEVLGHDRDRCAVRRGDRDPWIPGAQQKPVGFTRCLPRLDDAAPVHLVEAQRLIAIDAGRDVVPAAVLAHRQFLVTHSQAEIERGVGAEAHSASPERESEPRARGKIAGRGSPKRDGVVVRRGRLHCEDFARRAGAAQAICALLLAAGCAHGGARSTGGEARARFLETFARADSATRGVGMLAVRSGGKGREGMNTRWAAIRESLAVVAYAGPIRTLDATILGDSVYIAIRPYDLGLAGRVSSGAGLGPDELRFLARPWVFGDPGVRRAVERAAVEASGEGWRLAGTFDAAEGAHPFTLELSAKAEPRTLRIRLSSDDRNSIAIRYGPVARYQSGRVPRWIEWTRGTTRIRLDIEDHALAKPSQFRRLPPARDEWTILALDDPRGRDLLRRLFGVGDSEAAP